MSKTKPKKKTSAKAWIALGLFITIGLSIMLQEPISDEERAERDAERAAAAAERAAANRPSLDAYPSAVFARPPATSFDAASAPPTRPSTFLAQ